MNDESVHRARLAEAIMAEAQRGLTEPVDVAAEDRLLRVLEGIVDSGNDSAMRDAIARLEREDAERAAELRMRSEGVAGAIGLYCTRTQAGSVATLYCLPVLLYYAGEAPRNPRTRLANPAAALEIRNLMVAAGMVGPDAMVLVSRHLYLPSDLVATSFCGARQIAHAFVGCLDGDATPRPDQQLLAPEGDGLPTENPARQPLQLRYLLFMVVQDLGQPAPFAPVADDEQTLYRFTEHCQILSGHLGRLVLRELGLTPGQDDCQPLAASPFFHGLRQGMHTYLEEQLLGSIEQVLRTHDVGSDAVRASLAWHPQHPLPGVVVTLADAAEGSAGPVLASLIMPVIFEAPDDTFERVMEVLATLEINLAPMLDGDPVA